MKHDYKAVKTHFPRLNSLGNNVLCGTISGKYAALTSLIENITCKTCKKIAERNDLPDIGADGEYGVNGYYG